MSGTVSPIFDGLRINGNLTVTGTDTQTGPLVATSGTFSTTLAVAGTGPITGFGMAIGQVPQWVNWNGSGFPGLHLSNRIIVDRATPALNDFADWDIRRTTTFTGGTRSNINAGLRVTGVYGANDGTQELNAVFRADTAGTSGGLAVGSYSTAFRSLGGSDGVWGSISAVTDLNVSASSTSGSQVIGQEIDVQVNKADDGANGAAFGGAGVRYGLNIAAVRFNAADTAQTEVTSGLWFSTVNLTGATDTHTNFKSAIGFAVNAQTQSALDTRGAITPAGSANPVSAVTMSAGHVIDFNGGTTLASAPRNYWWWDGATSKMKYNVGATTVLSVDSSGNVRALGTITPSVAP